MISASQVKELRGQTGAGMLDCKKALEETFGDIEKAIDWLRENGISKATKKADRIATEGLVNVYVEGNNGIILEINAETDFVAKNEKFKALVERVSKEVLASSVTDLDSALALPIEDGTISDMIVEATAKIGEKISFRRFIKVSKNDNESFGAYLHMGGRIGVLSVVENGDDNIAKDISMHVAAMNPKYINKEEVSSNEIEKEKKILKEQALNEGKPENIVDKMVEGRISKYYKEICLLEQPFVKDSDTTVKKYIESNKVTVKKFIRFELGEGMQKREENFAEEVMSQING